MSKGNKEEQKWLLGESLNQYDRSLKEELGKVEKRNREQNHKISALINAFDDDYIKKEEENTNISLDYSKEGIVIVDDIKGNTLVNNVKDSNKELILNGDIDTQGVNITLEDTVDNGKVDVVLEGNTEVNLSKTKDPIMITHKFDDINSNSGKLQTTIDEVTTVNDSPGKVDVKEITGDTLVNHVSNGSEELILNGDIETNGYSNVTLTEGIDGGKVDISLEGNTMVNVCDQEDPVAITKSYTIETGNHIALQGEYDGKCRPNIYGNTLVNLVKEDYTTVKTITNTIDHNKELIKPNTIYTVCFEIINNNLSQDTKFVIEFHSQDSDAKVYINSGEKGFIKRKVTTSDVVSHTLWISGSDSDSVDIQHYMILEGDYTNKPIPDYFTGIKSSFEDKLVPENLYKFSSKDDFYSLDGGTTLDGEYIKMTANSGYQNAMLKPLDTIKPSTTYTIIADVVENTLNSRLVITSNASDKKAQLCSPQSFQVEAGKTGIFTRVVTSRDDLDGYVRCLINYLDITNTTGSIKYRIMVVEGDYTNYDFTDYDKTKAGKYKVDYKVTGKNKIKNFTDMISNATNNVNITDTKIEGTPSNSGFYVVQKIYLYSNIVYNMRISNVTGDNARIRLMYSNNLDIYIANVRNNFTVPHDGYYYIRIDNNGNTTTPLIVESFQVEEGTTATTYEPYKEYIKTLYLNSPLLEGDTIEQSGNNIIHNHRYGKVILDGSNYVPTAEKISVSTGNYRWVLIENNTIKDADVSIGLGICDKYPIMSPDNTWRSIEGIGQNNMGHKIVLYLDRYKDGSNVSKQALINELSTSPITFVYELATPTQEIISTNDNLLLDSYTNGHLDVDSVVPIDKVVFKANYKSLKYLYPNTEYIIQFESDNVGELEYYMGGTAGHINVVKGINKINCTTNDTIKWLNLDLIGIGFNMSKIVVTPKVDNDFGYFKGMKSVGECEGNKIEILSRNKNLFDSNNITKNKYITGQVGTHQYGDYGDSIYTNVSDYMPVKQGKVYIFSYEYETLSNVGERAYCYYDNNKNIIIPKIDTIYDVSKKSTTYTPQQDGYIKIAYDKNCTNIQFEQSDVKTSYSSYAINKKEILLTEPLRGLPNGVKDKYVIIDGKWYIERNCVCEIFDGSNDEDWRYTGYISNRVNGLTFRIIKNTPGGIGTSICTTLKCDKLKNITPKEAWGANSDNTEVDGSFSGIAIGTGVGDGIDIRIPRKILPAESVLGFKQYLQNNPITVVYQLPSPTYEPIDYNPFEVYTDTTYISNNSTIPCNMVIRNSGFNTISLKENTKYTAYVNNKNNVSLTYKIDNNAIAVNSSNKFTFTTPSTLVDKTIRIASKGNKIENLMIIEGTPQNDPIGYFDSLKSSYECEKVTDVNDENFGKYKVDARVVGENFESTQTVYLNSPLLKGDKIIWKDNKLQHYHKMKTIVFDGSDDEGWKRQENIDTNNTQRYYIPNTTVKINSLLINNVFPTALAGERDDLTHLYVHNELKRFDIKKLKTDTRWNDVNSLKKYLQQNPITVVYELATPYYEEISEYPLKFSSIANCSLSTTSNIQVSNISFNIYEETLPYLYNDKKYYITFNSDISKEIIINLGGSELTYTTKVGFNKVEITTPSDSNNMLTFNGQGVNINNVKVTQQNIDSYFEGMKSVGECEDLEIVSNNKNLYNFDWTILSTKNDYGTSNGYFGTIQKLRPNTKYYITIKNNNNINFGNYYVYTQGSSKGFIWVVNPGQNVQGNNSGAILTDDTGFVFFRTSNNTDDVLNKLNQLTFQIEEGTETTEYTPPKHNKQTMTHEPLRGLPNGVKDKYVIIDGKWYIERNCGSIIFDGSEDWTWNALNDITLECRINLILNNKTGNEYTQCDSMKPDYKGDYERIFLGDTQSFISLNKSKATTVNQFKAYLQQNPVKVVYQLKTSTYEPIDYNPFEVYTDITHISNNSLIPANMVIKNTGYNCILKPNTKYTVVTNTQGSISAKIGSTKVDSTSNVFTIITPSTLIDSVLRFSGKGLTTKDIMLLEGDKTNYIPKYFTGMESAFEQEYDEEKNKYKVNVKVTDGNKENNITFYINEPLRGVGDIKDKVYVKEDKVVVERNCAKKILNGSEDITWNALPIENRRIIRFYTNQLIENTNNVKLINVCDKFTTSYSSINTFEYIYLDKNLIIGIDQSKVKDINSNSFKQWLQQNPTTVVYQLATPVYEEVECDLSKLMLENYENSSLILNSNIPPIVDVRYKGEAPIVSATKELSSNVESTTTDINENIIPYMCDMDYRIVELQLKNVSTQGLEVNVLGLDSEDVLFNNRKANKIFNPSYEMLKRDILSKRYSTDEYKYRLERYLLANKISNEEYNELEELINNGR